MPAALDKLIVTDVSALKAKYGDGYASINEAIKKLIDADAARGVKCRLVALDSASQMKPHQGKPVVATSRVAREKETKAAIDALYKSMSPAYIVILGAPDVVPHQTLRNPARDEDPSVASDLPYACDAPYSTSAAKFVGPTRVVGRLPDLVGGADAKYLVKLLGVAAGWKSAARKKYEAFLGLTAAVWHESTELSLTNLFPSAPAPKQCPPGGPNWTAAQLKPLSHFINCHGDTPDNQFYGEDEDENIPVAMMAAQINGKLAAGTIVSAECCYGAELYDPALTDDQPGICSVYLDNKALAFFGSTTIAYGPPTGNGSADLICQFFLKHVLAGASTGRAALQARQDFVGDVTHLDPIDLKTLAQFQLLGDPAVHPVKPPPKVAPAAHAKTAKASKKAKSLLELVSETFDRSASRAVRRAKLAVRGLAVQAAASLPRPDAALKPSGETRRVLDELAAAAGIATEVLGKFSLAGPRQLAAKVKPKALRAVEQAPTAYFIETGLRDPNDPRTRIAFVAKEQSGELIGVRQLYRR
jgi:hypothetical protein